jgi:hypothetical protein
MAALVGAAMQTSPQDVLEQDTTRIMMPRQAVAGEVLTLNIRYMSQTLRGALCCAMPADSLYWGGLQDMHVCTILQTHVGFTSRLVVSHQVGFAFGPVNDACAFCNPSRNNEQGSRANEWRGKLFVA